MSFVKAKWFLKIHDSRLGGALKCNSCFYTSEIAESKQRCTNQVVNCASEYCLTAIIINPAGNTTVARNCDNIKPEKVICPDARAKEKCDVLKKDGYKSCRIECCKTDNCNNYTPGGAIGIMATKFATFLMLFTCLLIV